MAIAHYICRLPFQLRTLIRLFTSLVASRLLPLGPVATVLHHLAAILLANCVKRLADFANLGLVGAVGNLHFGVANALSIHSALHVAGLGPAGRHGFFHCLGLAPTARCGRGLIYPDNYLLLRSLHWGG